MDALQTIQISPSNGKVGTFYGAALVDNNEVGVTVVDIVFEKPRLVAGLQFRLSDLFAPTHGEGVSSPVDRDENAAPTVEAVAEAAAHEQQVLLSKREKPSKFSPSKKKKP